MTKYKDKCLGCGKELDNKFNNDVFCNSCSFSFLASFVKSENRWKNE
jgi:DNA-directed RNA polymerase subunit RPC12/RpoP